MTLVEVVVATILLGIGVTGLLSATSLAIRNQRRSESRMQALYVAQERLAEIEQAGAHAYLLGRPLKGEAAVGPNAYAWDVEIEQHPVGQLFSVHVTVSGGGPSGAQAELTTWLNDYETAALTPVDQRDRTSPSDANRPGGER